MLLALICWLMAHPEFGHHHGGSANVGSRLKRVT